MCSQIVSWCTAGAWTATLLSLSFASCSGTRVEQLANERAPIAFGHAGAAGEEAPVDPAQPFRRSRQEPGLSDPLPADGIEAYVALALERNPVLRAAFARWKSELARIPQAGALPDPVLSFGHFIEEIQTRTGPQRNRIGLTQSFPWFGTLGAKEDAARRDAEAAWQDVLAARLAVERGVRKAYYGYALLHQRIRVSGDQLALLRQLEPSAARRITTGGASSDLVRLQLAIGRLESELDSLRDQRLPRSRMLERALSLQRQEPLPWPPLAEPDFYRVATAELLQRAGKDNPELRALAHRIEAGRELVRVAEKSGYPQFTVGVDWIDTGDAMNPNTPGSGDDPYLLRAGVSLPIWRDKYDGMKQQARSELDRRGHAFAAKRDEIRWQLEEVIFALHDAQRRVELVRDTLLPRAQEAWRLVTTDFRGGSQSVLDLLESERVLLAMEIEYWRAVSEWWMHEADLRALAGGEIR